MSRWIFSFVLLLLMSGAILGGAVSVAFVDFLDTPLAAPKRVVIDKGWNLNRIARFLENQGIVPSAYWFIALTRVYDRRPLRLHAGEYQFVKGETPPRVLYRMLHGEVVRYRFTFQEGLTARDVATRMRSLGWTDAEHLVQEERTVKKLGLSTPAIEGWLFPETYQYLHGDTTFEMLSRMTRMSRKILEQEYANRAPEVTLSAYEALILASIIEKETGQAAERTRISGVFHNRLKRHMRLESDPTVIYGLADYDGDITRQHLTTATPYNTYLRAGLPPTPICNPGQASIYAALHPDKSEELFFVAQGDGTHVFSTTFQEHKANVNRFQMNRKRPPSAPAPGKHEQP